MDKHLFTQVLIHFFIAVRETHQSRFQTPRVLWLKQTRPFCQVDCRRGNLPFVGL